MASKFAVRALGAIALPGAFLAVVAPAASAAEIAPLSQMNAQGSTTGTDAGTEQGEASMLPSTTGFLSDKSLSL